MPTKEPKTQEKSSGAIFSIHKRFLRSTHLERDWYDPEALENYVYTEHARKCIERIFTGLKPGSSLRAWRITGDYGSGKSSFALLLANIFAGRLTYLSEDVKMDVNSLLSDLSISSEIRLIPILITGSREPLGYAILKALLSTLKEYKVHGNFYTKLDELLQLSSIPDDEVVIDWVKRSHQYLVNNQKVNGTAFILDEAGKFLEFAALRPDKQDVYLLQRLAEMSARSNKFPLYILSIFHQGLSAYTDSLARQQQKEWEKVAGRYEEIIWHYPIDQIVTLITHSLNTNLARISNPNLKIAKRDMQTTIKLGWFGNSSSRDILNDNAEKLYPIHPTVIPVLVRLFSEFGQNERSLFSFLLGIEPFGLQDFTNRTSGKQIFRLHHLYDYVKNIFGSKLSSLNPYWKTIENIISSYIEKDSVSLPLLKIIGVLNLVNSAQLIASLKSLSLAFGQEVEEELSSLEEDAVVYYRGSAGGFCLWSHTSVNLKEAYQEAKKALGVSNDLKLLLKERLQFRPIVARKHYIQTGNLRYFEISYIDPSSLAAEVQVPHSGDGYILVPLCETMQEVQSSIDVATSIELDKHPNLIIAIPEPLKRVVSFLDEVRRWEWIENTTGELRQDKHAREEVSRQLSLCRQELQQQLQSAVGLTNVSHQSHLHWYYQGQRIEQLQSERDIVSFLTTIVNSAYASSPRIHNELINRRFISSAGASARMRLCERLFESPNLPYLGMDPSKNPPEMSMYLSVLKEAGLHKKTEGTDNWFVELPSEDYDNAHCRILPAVHRIHSVLTNENDKTVSVTTLFEALRSMPYGVTDGMIPLLLAVFAVIHEQELAFYEDGTFVPRMTGSIFLRLIKAPETFDVQYYPIQGVRNELFQRLVHELNLKIGKKENIDLLDVVRPLILFVGNLPEYVINTSYIAPETRAMKSLLLKTTNPVQLLFYDLPAVFGLSPISESVELKANESFVEKLKVSLDELRVAYPLLLTSIEMKLLQEFDIKESFDTVRAGLARRAEAMLPFITEIRLKSFCIRIADTQLVKNLWLESLGNLVCSMPPAKWRDKDVFKYEQEVHKLVQQFMRVEATLYRHPELRGEGQSVRVALTRPSGEEREQVVHLSGEQLREVEDLQIELAKLLSKQGQVGLAAASRVLWEMMNIQE